MNNSGLTMLNTGLQDVSCAMSLDEVLPLSYLK